MRWKKTGKKTASVLLSAALVVSLGCEAGPVKKAKAAEAQKETLYYNFHEITDVAGMTVNQDYAFFTQTFEDSQAVISLPSDGAIVKFGGDAEKIAAGTGFDGKYTYANYGFGSCQLRDEHKQGFVHVEQKGASFDTCQNGGIGYATIKAEDNIEFNSSSIPYNGTAEGTGWWYGCTGSAVFYCGPYHVYTYDEYEFTADDIKIEKADSWTEPTGETVVKKDDIVVKVHVQDGTMDEWVSVPFYDISSSDNTVDPTKQDNKITVTLGSITKQVEITAAHSHVFSTDWSSDETNHWHACTAANCDGTVADKAAHTASDWIVDKAATETEVGSEHKECTVCKKVLETREIAKLPHSHTFSTDWSSDEKDHWHACTAANCDGTVADKAAHTTSDWIVDKAATETEAGSKHKECIVCKKVLETATIPKNSSSDGTVTVIDSKVEEGAPKAELASDADQVKKSVELTKEEEEAVAQGAVVDIYLQIASKEETVTQEEKNIIEKAKEDYTIGTYIDTSLYKKVGTKDPVAVTNLKDKVKVQLELPETLKNTDKNMVRSYSLIGIKDSDGTTEVIEGEYNEETGTFTFETDSFTTYAIAYKDVATDSAKVEAAKKDVEQTISEIANKSNTTAGALTEKEFKAQIQKILQEAGVEGTVEEYKVVNATKTKEGTITAKVTITSGDVKKTITVTAKIPKKLSGNSIAKLDLPLLMVKGIGGNKKISLSWTKDKKAQGYEIYWSYCNGKQNFKLLKDTKKLKTTHTKLSNGKAYKYFVVSYKLVDGQKVYLRKSAQIHVAMSKQKKTNAKKITVKKANYTLKVNKSAKISAKTVKLKKNKKVLKHAKEFRYFTSNKKIATVTNAGVIKAKKKGSCKIYVMANNGVYKTVKVTVK